MKFIWETKDVNAISDKNERIVSKNNQSEKWMIGYMASRPLGNYQTYTINSTRDGMVRGPYTRDELIKELNKCEYKPEKCLG